MHACRKDTLGLGALAAKAKNVTTTGNSQSGDSEHPWTATVYFEPDRPRVAARPRYWISLSKEAEDAPVVARAFWEKVCEIGSSLDETLWMMDAEQQRLRVKEAVEGVPDSRSYLEPVLAQHDGVARDLARAVVDHLWECEGVWLVATQNEIRAAHVAWPAGFGIKITRYEEHNSQLVVVVPSSLTPLEHNCYDLIIRNAIGMPSRTTPTYFCYPLTTDLPDQVTRLVERLMSVEHDC